MPAATFHLISIRESKDSVSFIDQLRTLPGSQRPSWIGTCQHWIHEPHLSVNALNGTDNTMLPWDYLLVFKSSSLELPATMQALIQREWSISVSDAMIDNLPPQTPTWAPSQAPTLPAGWTAEDSSGLNAAESPAGLEMTLSIRSHAFGASKAQPGTQAKDIIGTLGTKSPGPVAMFNLLSYLPGQRARYFEYATAFGQTIGPAHGGEPLIFGVGVTDWTTKLDEEAGAQDGGWEDIGLIYYPSIWHFGKMLDDPVYADLDRRHKGGVIRNNAILCCGEVKL